MSVFSAAHRMVLANFRSVFFFRNALGRHCDIAQRLNLHIRINLVE